MTCAVLLLASAVFILAHEKRKLNLCIRRLQVLGNKAYGNPSYSFLNIFHHSFIHAASQSVSQSASQPENYIRILCYYILYYYNKMQFLDFVVSCLPSKSISSVFEGLILKFLVYKYVDKKKNNLIWCFMSQKLKIFLGIIKFIGMH